MRIIDADALGAHMFHGYGTEITPVDIDAETYKLGWNDAIEAIMDNAPTIEPERKKGEWIHKPDIYLDEQTWECSECGEPWIFIEGTPSENNANFCPNCGSYNGGKEHETD